MSTSILATKLYIPPPRAKIVLRPRLIEKLNEGLTSSRAPGVTLISASAGFGKTTLVSEWIAGCGRPVAWLSLDELWAKVKQAKQDIWVWMACKAKTKIIPVIQLGPRTQDMAYSVVHELKTKMITGCVPVFSSDGLQHYFYALTAHFGEWICPDGELNAVWHDIA